MENANRPLPLREEQEAAIDTADNVRHGPSGEDWLVARVSGKHLYPCGWPPSCANLSDCTLTKKATEAERRALLQKLADGNGQNAAWAREVIASNTTPKQEAVTAAVVASAAKDVLAERQRQVEAEGWTPEHDDEHDRGEMARAAGCYAIVAGSCQGWPADTYKGVSAPSSVEDSHDENADTFWPWDKDDWKPKNPRRDLVRAAALILAEIERIDRAEASRRWKPCSRCTTPDYCTNQLRGCDISESAEAGIAPLAGAASTIPRVADHLEDGGKT